MADPTPTSDLLKQALAEARELVELEVRIAKEEMREELGRTKRSAIAGAAAAVLALLTLSALVMALILGLGGGVREALLVALGLGVLGGTAGAVTYALAPKAILPRTRDNLKKDVHELKEHAT
jgi:hypothetical protein